MTDETANLKEARSAEQKARDHPDVVALAFKSFTCSCGQPDRLSSREQTTYEQIRDISRKTATIWKRRILAARRKLETVEQ